MQVCVLTKYPYRDGGTKWPSSHISSVRCYHDSVVGYITSKYCEDSVTSSSAQDGDI